ncbi:IS4 family transposase [Roseimaritima ulvae]|uniref:Transposase DDE domain protein n=1 Tax=Roseimaritima ulvae TaxID=980254 RepID=A0A5B9QR05_9BACT|nr:IS4 family transposase [Roseimaritima ulvae]QEG39466.1 Transposase DDE domain protein [Roseimaritima ulvae]
MVAPTNESDPDSPFCRAKTLLADLIGLPQLQAAFEGQEPSHAKRVYTQAPTLWLLVMQRLGGGLSLEQVVKDLINNHSDILPENRRVTEGKLSENNSAYNKARQNLPIEVIEEFSHRVCDHLARRAEPAFLDQRVFILDGTTITLPPTQELKKAFPPAMNKHGESVWPVACLMVAHEMQTGCALVPQVDPMYGSKNSSEPKQAEKIIDRLPENSIVLADSGFGIFSVAFHCQLRAKPFVFRLTKQRYKAYIKKATLIEETEGCRTYHLIWKPTAKERKKHPALPADAAVEAFIHQVDLENGQTLELVTNVETDGVSVGELYRRRYDIEFDIRDLKVTMDSENIRAKSVDTVKKELLGSVIAYNLVTQLRKQAAKLINVKPRRLSFSGVWTTFRYDLLYKDFNTLEEWNLAYQGALVSASGRKLPNRKEPRSYPRLAHARRQKTTKFQKSLRKSNTKAPTPPPD